MNLGLELGAVDLVRLLPALTLICLGSAVLTIFSLTLDAPGAPDRTAANIVTGIGFLGAGAIFKEGKTICGLVLALVVLMLERFA